MVLNVAFVLYPSLRMTLLDHIVPPFVAHHDSAGYTLKGARQAKVPLSSLRH